MQEELNKKLAKWAGFKLQTVWPEYCDLGKVLKWTYPDGKYHRDPPNFTESLDACFKWLVPNEDVSIVGVAFKYYPGGTEAIVTVRDEAGFTEYKGWVENEEPKEYTYEKSALALCLAISKLIEKDVDSVNMAGEPA